MQRLMIAGGVALLCVLALLAGPAAAQSVEVLDVEPGQAVTF